MSDIDELNREVTRLLGVMLAACQRYVESQAAVDLEAWLAATCDYQRVHRQWWSLAMSDVAYDAVFGG